MPPKHREHGAGDDPYPQESVWATDQAGDDKTHCHPLHEAASQKPQRILKSFDKLSHRHNSLPENTPSLHLSLGVSQGHATELDIPQVVALPFMVKSHHATSRGSHSMKDNTVSNKYGLPQVQNRPQIKAEKNLCLNGEEGRQIIKSETKLTLKTHEKTFTRLADM